MKSAFIIHHTTSAREYHIYQSYNRTKINAHMHAFSPLINTIVLGNSVTEVNADIVHEMSSATISTFFLAQML